MASGVGTKKKNFFTKVLYRELGPGGEQKIDNCLLMPIKSKEDIILGVLEISNTTPKNDLGCDDEYLCMVLVRLMA